MAGPTETEKAMREWSRLVEKLSGRALRSMPVYLVPREVQILVTSMDEITTQAMLLQKVIEKYPDLWNNLVETLNVEPESIQDVRGVQPSDGGSPGAVRDTSEAGGLRAVAGGA